MSLLDPWVYPVAVVLAVLSVGGGAVATWRTPRRAWGLAVNALVIAVASVLVTLSVALVLNHDNGWYMSWSDVWQDGGAGGVQSTSAGAASAVQVFQSDRLGPVTDDRTLPALPSPGQRIQVFRVPTSVGTAAWDVTVILPADYLAAASAHRAYPVLMAGHGMPGAMQQWSGPIDIRRYADPLADAHALSPMITVVPALEPGSRDTECVFGPGGSTQVETWLSRDVPAFVQAHLRARTGRAAWAWIGISAGAWCAAMLTMRHPDVFGAAITLGGYYRPWWAGSPPWPLTSPQEREYDLVALAKERPPAVALWVHSTRQDKESWPSTQEFLKAVRPPTLVKATIDPTGGHTWTSWLPHVTEALTWLGATVPGFGAG